MTGTAANPCETGRLAVVGHGLVPSSDPWSQPTRLTIKLAEIAILTALYTFPGGRFVPQWTRVPLIVFVLWAAIGLAVPSVDPVVARGVWQLLFVLFFLSGLLA